MQHYKEIKNLPERVSNLKIFLDIYIYNCRICPEIVLIVLYVDVNVETHKVGQRSITHKSMKQSNVSNHYHVREKKAVLLLIPDDIST